MSKAVQQEIEDFKRKLLSERLEQLTQKQRDFFNRIFPIERFPNGVPADDLVNAIDLCDRTIKKNLENPARLEA